MKYALLVHQSQEQFDRRESANSAAKSLDHRAK
jgi:hypothetical protein